MEAKFSFAIVGTFVIVLGAALIGGVLWLTSGRYYGKTYDVYHSYMRESVAGLNTNAPVKYHGVDVGFVRGIALNPANVEEVELTLAILHGTPVKQDTVAILQSQGLTGIAYVDLTGGQKDSPPLTARPGEPYPVIPSGPSLLSRLDVVVTATLEKLSRALDGFNAVMDAENRRNIAQTLADLKVISGTLAKRSGTIDATLADASRTMANASRFTAELPALAARIERSAESFDRMTDRLATAGSSATQLVEDSRGDLAHFTGEALPEMRELVAELREAASTLRRATREVERNPSVLVWGSPAAKHGPGE